MSNLARNLNSAVTSKMPILTPLVAILFIFLVYALFWPSDEMLDINQNKVIKQGLKTCLIESITDSEAEQCFLMADLSLMRLKNE